MSKGIYIGVDDKARKVTKAYIGVDGVARKILKGYEGNENGIARQFYSAEKAHYWRRYNANYWDVASHHTIGSNVTNYPDSFWAQKSGITLYGSYVFDAYTGNFILSGAQQSVAWIPEPGDESGKWEELSPECYNTYVIDPQSWSGTTSGKLLYKISGGVGLNSSDYAISMSSAQYAKPTAHATGYTLIKGTSATEPPLTPSYPLLDSGYSYDQWSYDGMDTYRSYDDYYWEYDGYHE